MSYQISVSVYELKANLSKFLRALHRGDADAVVINRYGRPSALMISFHHGKPALEPQTKDDIAMRSRARFVNNGAESRRTRND